MHKSSKITSLSNRYHLGARRKASSKQVYGRKPSKTEHSNWCIPKHHHRGTIGYPKALGLQETLQNNQFSTNRPKNCLNSMNMTISKGAGRQVTLPRRKLFQTKAATKMGEETRQKDKIHTEDSDSSNCWFRFRGPGDFDRGYGSNHEEETTWRRIQPGRHTFTRWAAIASNYELWMNRAMQTLAV